MTDKFIQLTEKIAKICGIFAAGCLLASIVLITELVFERYLFKNAITWQTELVTILLVASTFIGSAYVLSEKGHVNMEYLYTFLSEKNVLRLRFFTDTLCLFFFLTLLYVSVEITADAFINNHNTGTVWGPPLWIPYSSMLIGAILMTMSYIAELIKLSRKLKG
jgi:TRAP-type C4-dicarboxylate transport system permease small subunit